MRPELLVFGFTMAAVTMIISETLQIPLMGFILQPTCIPSKQYVLTAHRSWREVEGSGEKWRGRGRRRWREVEVEGGEGGRRWRKVEGGRRWRLGKRRWR
jgi:hypothetical protein